MPSVFTKIIEGELPGRFVWRDERCVAFLTIAPLRRGHVLVVPREEVEHWVDLEPDLWAHLAEVSRSIGRALEQAYRPEKVGMMLAGLEVPHVHVHLVPIDALADLDFSNADPDTPSGQLDEDAETVRGALRELGFAPVADA